MIKARSEKLSCGSVAAFVLINGKQMYVGNVGDSRAVLCRSGNAIDLTRDHTPKL